MTHNPPSPPNQFPTLNRIVKFLFAQLVPGMFAFGGAIFFSIGLWQLYEGWKTHNWPTTQGTITSSQIKEVTRRDADGDTYTNYRPSISYSYQVADQNYEGHRLHLGATSHNDRSAVQQQLKQYPVGRTLDVYYNPNNPNQAVLTPGVGGGIWIAITMGTAFLVLGIALSMILPKVMRSVIGLEQP